MKKYVVEFNQDELNILTGLFNEAVKAKGLENGIDQNARYFLNKIAAGEQKENPPGDDTGLTKA